ncbi:flavin reductase family protein [Sphingomonas bacterium]|uniref:flavin reductase family protein n=1 Tax=Sphingomonas bacterium TaxID=1895847 RepID=UPI001576B5E9|nr:flavin reductase family protein [Sphingomonas bacterium]
MTEWHSYDPADGHRLAHDPLSAIVAPRPIGWISTLSSGGIANLAPYSFFSLFNYRPPIIGFASTGGKDSLANAEATGEFVWNLVTRDLAEPMSDSSATLASDVDEFAMTGLDRLPSQVVKPARVARSPVQFECRVTQIVRLLAADGREINQHMVLGEAVMIHIDPGMLEDGVYQTARPRPITRGGGLADYFEITQDRLFKLGRPR